MTKTIILGRYFLSNLAHFQGTLEVHLVLGEILSYRDEFLLIAIFEDSQFKATER